MFRKTSVVFAVFVVGLLLVTPQSFGTSGEASWTLAGCWINVEVSPDNLNLGTYTDFVSGDVVEDSSSSQQVTVKTNCMGYTLNVEPDSFSLPAGHKGQWNSETEITDFKLKGEVTNGNVSCEIPDFENFTSMSDSKQVLTTSNPKTTHTDMNYRYIIDDNDVPGDYTVTLLYTTATD